MLIWFFFGTLTAVAAGRSPVGLTFETYVSRPSAAKIQAPSSSFVALVISVGATAASEGLARRVSVTANWTAGNKFFQPAADPESGPTKAVDGVFCEGVPNVTFPAPFAPGGLPGDLPGYGAIGVSPYDFCVERCGERGPPRCRGPAAALAALCKCDSPSLTAVALPNVDEPILKAELVSTGGPRTRWVGESYFPFWILGSDVRGLEIVVLAPREWIGRTVVASLAGANPRGDSPEWLPEGVFAELVPAKPPRGTIFAGALTELSTGAWFALGLFRDVLGVLLGTLVGTWLAAAWRRRCRRRRPALLAPLAPPGPPLRPLRLLPVSPRGPPPPPPPRTSSRPEPFRRHLSEDDEWDTYSDDHAGYPPPPSPVHLPAHLPAHLLA